MNRARRLRLDHNEHDGSVRFLTGMSVRLAEGAKTSVVTIVRTGSFTDPRYGRFEITKEMLLSMVRNFESGVVGQEIFFDRSHHPEDGAAAKVLALFVDGNRLRAKVEWTPFGVELVRDKGFRYLSADFHENWVDNESGQAHGPTLLGAGLTVRPVVKRLDPIQLSEHTGEGHATLLHPELAKTLSEEIHTMWEALIKKLSESLKKLKLGDDIVKQFTDRFTKSLDGITDEAQAKLLMQAFESGGKQLAEQIDKIAVAGEQNIKLDFSSLDQALATARKGDGITAEDVKKLLAEEQKAQAEKAKQLTESREAKVKLFTDTIDAAEGLKSLSEESRAHLLEASNLITADMADDQVKALAEHQIKLGNDLAVQAELVRRGWPTGPAGSVHISMDASNQIKKLQEEVDRRLGLTELSDARRYERTGGVLLTENKTLADKAVEMYDQLHGAELDKEAKQLAAGDGIVSDVSVPAVWERTVIREALYQMVGLNFVNGGTEAFATSYMIPYSYRDTTAAGLDSTRKYEGQAVQRAGVIQTAETAYNIPQKLAFEVSDELRYLTAARHLDWDAVQENQRNATRIVAEDGDRIILNETVQASDEYGAVAVGSAEDLELQADGAKNVFILANFPVVRPRSVFDLQGNQVGSTVNPIVVNYNSVALSEYDGTGAQAPGTYYSLDYNLGEIRLVDETGAIQVPADATAYDITYSYATNVYNFDTDLGSALPSDHWDTFLYRYGLRKSVLEDDRFHMATFGLMRGAVVSQIEQAKQFGANHRRPGTDLSMDGTLGRIKDVPNFKAFGPSLWMADNRVVIGERGITRFRMTKPWTLGELENQKDSNGRFTGKKEAYGDQFIVVHTPTQLKRAYTTMNLYSASARVARAE